MYRQKRKRRLSASENERRPTQRSAPSVRRRPPPPMVVLLPLVLQLPVLDIRTPQWHTGVQIPRRLLHPNLNENNQRTYRRVFSSLQRRRLHYLPIYSTSCTLMLRPIRRPQARRHLDHKAHSVQSTEMARRRSRSRSRRTTPRQMISWTYTAILQSCCNTDALLRYGWKRKRTSCNGFSFR